MTRLQFVALLVPSISSFVLVILAWLHSNSRSSDLREFVNLRFDDVNRRFDGVDRRFEEVYRRQDEANRHLTLIEADQTHV